MMETYIVMGNFTKEGIENIKESPRRLEAAKQWIEHAGGRWKGWYLTMGRYDFVLLAEAPNGEAAAVLTLATASLGNVRTETMRAFTEQEYERIIVDIP